MQLQPKNAVAVVKATCALHNFIRSTQTQSCPSNLVDATQSATLTRESQKVGLEVRDHFSNWCVNEGAVSWQDSYLNGCLYRPFSNKI